MTQKEFNTRIQDVQMWPLNYRSRSSYEGERLVAAYFEVFWDHWVVLGVQHNPLRDDATYYWDEEKAGRILAEVAYSLAH